MSRAAYIVCLIAFVSVFSQFGKTILGLVGMPNVIPAIRDISLIALAVIAISRTDFFKSTGFYGAVLLCMFILVLNIFIALFDGRIFAGFYYARLYALPLFFSVASYGLIMTLNNREISRLAGFVYYGGALVVAASIIIFSAVELNPLLLRTLMGSEQTQLASAWYIAGGIWLRMGLPATGPNSLGLFVGLYLLFLLALQFSGRANEVGGRQFRLVISLSVAVLLMTFSRSSWLACFFGVIALFFSCRKEWELGRYIRPMAIVGYIVGGVALAVIVLLSLDSYSNGAVTRWLELNISGKDPSMIGHQQTLVVAWELLDKYFSVGYPRGSVGPKALLFGGGFFNVENSLVGIFYDMGVPIGLGFIVSVGLLLRGMWMHRSQISILVAFLLASQFLPYAFEADVIIFFIMIYVVQGRLMSFPARSLNPVISPSIYSSNKIGGRVIRTFPV